MRQLVRRYSPPRRELRDIRDQRTLQSQGQLVADRYAHEQRIRYERWLGLRPLAPTVRKAA